MSTHLLEIAKKAEADKTYRFQNLSRELNEEFLQDCWKTLRRDAASGVDQVTVAEYQTHLKENLQDLVKMCIRDRGGTSENGVFLQIRWAEIK